MHACCFRSHVLLVARYCLNVCKYELECYINILVYSTEGTTISWQLMQYVNIIVHYWLYSVGTSRTGLSLVAKHPNLWDCAKHGVRFRLNHTVPQWAYCIALNFLGTEIYRLASCKFHGNKFRVLKIWVSHAHLWWLCTCAIFISYGAHLLHCCHMLTFERSC